MRPATKNSKKDEASSDDSTVHLETINEDDLPEVTGTRNFKTGRGLEPFASLGISFDPDMLANLEEFTPHQESFLTTLLEGTTSRLIHVHQTALQVQQEEIQRLQTHMRDMQDKMNETRPLTSMETPRAIRPQDVEYQSLLNTAKKLKQESQQEERHGQRNSHVYGNDNNDMAGTMQTFLANMSSVLKNNNKSKDSVTELPKFQGADTQWPKWYQLLRAYLQAKGWLITFDHPIGPGTASHPTPDFDIEINEEIYQKLQSKCWDGTAITYIRMAAEFDGHGAGKQLKERYNKRSPQLLESYKKLAKELRHVSGTSMPTHVDQFEAILSYMPECGYVPTSSDRFEWFLPSVTEGIYASAKTLSLTQQINGTLEWGNLVHLFNHTCYQQYPHFQVAELQMNKSKLTQNALKIGQTPCPLHPDSQHTSAECKKLRELRSSGLDKGKRTGKGKGKRTHSSHSTPRTYPSAKKGKGYGGGKGKDKGNRSVTHPTPSKTWNVVTAERRDTLPATATSVSMPHLHCLRTRPPSPNLLQLLLSSNMSPTSKERQTNKRVMSRRISPRPRTHP